MRMRKFLLGMKNCVMLVTTVTMIILAIVIVVFYPRYIFIVMMPPSRAPSKSASGQPAAVHYGSLFS